MSLISSLSLTIQTSANSFFFFRYILKAVDYFSRSYKIFQCQRRNKPRIQGDRRRRTGRKEPTVQLTEFHHSPLASDSTRLIFAMTYLSMDYILSGFKRKKYFLNGRISTGKEVSFADNVSVYRQTDYSVTPMMTVSSSLQGGCSVDRNQIKTEYHKSFSCFSYSYEK